VDARSIKYRFGDAEFFDWLDELADRFERPEFIQNDPIQVMNNANTNRPKKCSK